MSGNLLPTQGSQGPAAATKWMAALLLVTAAALVLAVLLRRSAPAVTPVEPLPRTVSPRGDLAMDEQSTIELFSNASPAVVHVTSIQKQRSRLSMNVQDIPQGTGSGFVWDDKGHIVTNFHVIVGGAEAEVTLHDNSVWRASIVGRAPDKDLAVLHIDAPKDMLRPLAIGASSNLQVGQKVFAIGNPFGLDHTLTTGVISGLGREIESITKRPIQGVIQTDAAINPGNSGGPLLDSAGRLIGVNTANLGPFSGIGFAVPVDTINRIVPQLITHGKIVRPGLGVHIGTDQLSSRLNLQGVVVIEVPAESAAGRAGLQGTRPGENGHWILGDVIIGADDQPVRNSSDLFRQLDRHSVGERIDLEVENQGKRRKVAVELQALP